MEAATWCKHLLFFNTKEDGGRKEGRKRGRDEKVRFVHYEGIL